MLKKIARVDAGAIIPVVLMEDPILHTARRPFCKDATCPCQADRNPRYVLTHEDRRRGGQRR